MPKKIDCIGSRFGRVVVINEVPQGAGKRRRVLCRCDCGNNIVTDPRSLFIGHTKSCGCLQKEIVSKSSKLRCTTHGKTKTKEYSTWGHMKGRCYNKSNAKYKDYGGRGIKVCDRWLESFENFFEDMENAPSKFHSIERLNVNGDYEPSNCKWATNAEQAVNKRKHRVVAYEGRFMPLSEACRLAKVSYQTALYRLNKGKQLFPTPPTDSELDNQNQAKMNINEIR